MRWSGEGEHREREKDSGDSKTQLSEVEGELSTNSTLYLIIYFYKTGVEVLGFSAGLRAACA